MYLQNGMSMHVDSEFEEFFCMALFCEAYSPVTQKMERHAATSLGSFQYLFHERDLAY